MRKLQKAAVLVAMVGSVGFIGAGTASAGGHDAPEFNVQQATSCVSHDLNVDVLGNVGVLNGVAGNLLGGEGNPGAQATKLGSTQDCSNDAF
ncbi:hypothetical protein ACIRD8_12220 [Streptomyces sp. NPDC102451]|uniref:hypothetical protein n=1 Tax=Streptomyces sp. NPDC102451 TaxID=3366177 RepID=UPI0037FA0DE8